MPLLSGSADVRHRSAPSARPAGTPTHNFMCGADSTSRCRTGPTWSSTASRRCGCAFARGDPEPEPIGSSSAPPVVLSQATSLTTRRYARGDKGCGRGGRRPRAARSWPTPRQTPGSRTRSRGGVATIEHGIWLDGDAIEMMLDGATRSSRRWSHRNGSSGMPRRGRCRLMRRQSACRGQTTHKSGWLSRPE